MSHLLPMVFVLVDHVVRTIEVHPRDWLHSKAIVSFREILRIHPCCYLLVRYRHVDVVVYPKVELRDEVHRHFQLHETQMFRYKQDSMNE